MDSLRDTTTSLVLYNFRIGKSSQLVQNHLVFQGVAESKAPRQLNKNFSSLIPIKLTILRFHFRWQCLLFANSEDITLRFKRLY